MNRLVALGLAIVVGGGIAAASRLPTTPRAGPDALTTPRTFSGTGSTTTEALALNGGSYRFEWEVSQPDHGAPCILAVQLAAADGHGWPQLVGTATAVGRGESAIHNVAPGSYAVKVGGNCPWQVTAVRS